MKNKGFTLIELLITISILAILSVVGVVVFQGVTKNARDTKRKADIRAIHTSLELHFFKYGSYTQPETLCQDTSNGRGSDASACGVPVGSGDWDASSNLRVLLTDELIQSLPKDPTNNTTYYYYYEPTNAGERVPGEPSGSHYTLCASRLENTGSSFCLNSSN